MIATEKKYIIRKSLRIKILILLVLLLTIVFMFPKGESLESEVTVGSIWIQDDLIASTSFPIYKNEELYNLEKQRAADRVYPIFIKRDTVAEKVMDSISAYNKYLLAEIDKDIADTLQNRNTTFLSMPSYNAFKELRKRLKNPSAKSAHNFEDMFKLITNVVRNVYRVDVIDRFYGDIKRDSIAVRFGKFDRIEPKRKFQDLYVVNNLVITLANDFSDDPHINNALNEYLNHFLTPTLIYSEPATLEERELAKNKVSPNIGIVNENERIIAKHDRIGEEAKLKIDSYRKSKAEQTDFFNRYTQFAGKLLHIGLILTLFIIYLYLFRKKIYADNVKILLVAIIILFVAFITFIIHKMNVNAPVHLLIMVPAASMMFTIMFDSRVGFYGTIVVSLIVGGLRGNDYSFTAMNIFTGALAAYTVRDIKNRTQIFRSFFFILLGYFISILAFGLERFAEFNTMAYEFAFAASNALISPVFTFGMIIFFERAFKVTTDLTLLELTDFNRPILRDLAKKAPGTFTHSMTIGSLVERAAEAIGANPLLARVGAYYHDIGKTLNPHNFVENQMSNENAHEQLSPSESANLIISHVEKGIDLARKEGLPQEVIDFIPMHHGTLVVGFFYEKAKELYGEQNVNINDFRYEGPKPNTKETALVMLADACESTVRSIDEPDAQKVENVITKLIKHRVDDGQLNDSPITLNDLKIIKETFLSILLGHHHKRIRYPKQEELENAKEEKTDAGNEKS